ncbi:MAG: DUF1566 domain-containing protein [Prevotellaceae bacterium]|jgi:hypothetical protein|nr:DUF1566 domain-containing protein [Prevotellaceae bacterium]
MKKVLLILCLVCAATAWGQGKKKVVIATSVSKAVPESVSDAFVAAVEEGLNRNGKYEVLPNREEFKLAASEEAAFQEEGWVADEQKLDFGNAAGADYSCLVKIHEIYGNYAITYKLIDVKTGKTPEGGMGSADTENGTADLMKLRREIITAIAEGRSLSEKKKQDLLCRECCDDGGELVNCSISMRDEEPMRWDDAVSFCKSKGPDWDLPTKDELREIYHGRSALQRDGSKRFQPKDYWSYSKYNNHESYAVNFGTGEVDYYSKNIKNTFRCVKRQ